MGKVIYNLVYNHEAFLNEEGEASIQVEAFLGRHCLYFPTGIYVKPNQWDRKRRFVKARSDMDHLNGLLEDVLLELCEKERDLQKRGEDVTLAKLRDLYQHDRDSFLAFMEMRAKEARVRESTRRNHLSTVHLLRRLRKEVLFSELNYDYLCQLEADMKVLRYQVGTIGKHMKNVKRYLNLAIDSGLFDVRAFPFRRYKIKRGNSRRTHLLPEELARLEGLRLSGEEAKLQRTLDLFLFCCYTGLRFSDAVSLTKKNFVLFEDKLWLVYTSVKTGILVRLPLSLLFNGKAILIYRRYAVLGMKTLFGITNSMNVRVNRQLKKILLLANIHKPVTFHASRHTNATLLLYQGVSITTVQKLLGHRSVQTTEIYGEIMDMTVVRDLEKLG